MIVNHTPFHTLLPDKSSICSYLNYVKVSLTENNILTVHLKVLMVSTDLIIPANSHLLKNSYLLKIITVIETIEGGQKD